MADTPAFPTVGDGSGIAPTPHLYAEELQLAARNHALPLEGLRYDVTPAGLHYVLVHYDIPAADEAAWALAIDGAVGRPLTLSLDQLKARPQVMQAVTLQCAGDGRALMDPRPISQPWITGAAGCAEWTGTPLWPLLEEAGIAADARDIVFTGADRGFEGGLEQDYERGLPIAEAMLDGVIVAWAMNGQPLLPQHGFPLRLVAPGWYGMAQVKWLRRITVLTAPFEGYQQTTAYRYTQRREEPGQPVELMLVRSLMVPPGIPDFLTRTRVVTGGPVALEGRAWSGRSAVTRVEVSTDGGATWSDARVEPPRGQYAWQRWTATWQADTPGPHELLCRAHDARGDVQPLEQSWNARGMGNNQAHRVPVIVRDA